MAGELTPQQGDVMDFLGRPEYRKQAVATANSISEQLEITRSRAVRVLGELIRLDLVRRVRWRGSNRYELSSQGLAVQGYREVTRRWQRTTSS